MFLRPLTVAFLLTVAIAGPAPAAEDDLARLEAALHLKDVFDVMSEEGIAYGAEVEADLFPGPGGPPWRRAVDDIYDPGRIYPMFQARFEATLDADEAELASLLDFFGSDLGQRVTTLEISARRALLDPSVEEAGRLTYAETRARMESDPKLVAVDAFVEANDLVEANVTGAMNANLAFLQGLFEATKGTGPGGGDEEEMLAQVWSQEASIRAETDDWIHSYLYMAYAPLSVEELGRYTEFSETPEGRALNAALFAGFDAVFNDVSHRLGMAAGGVLVSRDL